MKKKEKKLIDVELTDNEKIYCIQRANGKSQSESIALAYNCSELDNKARINKGYALEKKERVKQEIETLKAMVIPAKEVAKQAKQIAISDIYTAQEKNEQLKKISEELILELRDDDGRIDTKRVDCLIKLLDLSARLSGQMINQVKVQSENISYQFLVDRQGAMPTIIDQKE